MYSYSSWKIIRNYVRREPNPRARYSENIIEQDKLCTLVLLRGWIYNTRNFQMTIKLKFLFHASAKGYYTRQYSLTTAAMNAMNTRQTLTVNIVPVSWKYWVLWPNISQSCELSIGQLLL